MQTNHLQRMMQNVLRRRTPVAGIAGGLLVGALTLGSLLWAAPAMAVTHEVRVTSEGFIPSELTIKNHDTVIWVWESGSHTVTTGTSPEDKEAGLVLDLSINSRTPRIEFTFNSSAVYDYFSRTAPGMRGSVTVQDGTPVDPATWGFIKQMFEDPRSPRFNR